MQILNNEDILKPEHIVNLISYKFAIDSDNNLYHFDKSGCGEEYDFYISCFSEYFTDEAISKYNIKHSNIMCQCGCKQFQLHYGDYRILATCYICNKEYEVYSG